MLSEHNTAYCIVSAPTLKWEPRVTADFAYVRMHGTAKWYSYNHTEDELKFWRDRIVELGQKADSVYIYFNNDFDAHAVRNATRLIELLADADDV